MLPCKGLEKMGVSIKDFLDLPLMREARVLAAEDAAGEQIAAWVAVIEHPVEDFVSEGEVVLTTGQGCDAAGFERLAAEIIEAGPAAVCVSLHPEGELDAIPDAVIELAEGERCPLIALPWELRFADVMRGLIDLIIATQYGANGQAPDELHLSFTTALLEGDGLDAVAEALERVIERPILVLDADFQPVGHGARAAAALGQEGLQGCWRAAFDLSIEQQLALRRSLVAYRPRAVREIPELGLGPGTIVCATARREMLGYVYALDAGPPRGLPSLDQRALQHASTAVSMELLRRRAIAETEARIRGDLFWDLALGSARSRQETATKAVLLGLSLRSAYQVAVARLIDGVDDDEALGELEAGLRAAGGDGLLVARRAGEVLALLPAGERPLSAIVAGCRDGAGPGEAINWGIAGGGHELGRLEEGYRAAVRALTVGHGLRGPGAIADGAELEPFLMLGALIDDPDAIRSAREVLAPIIAYDRETSRDLVGTLETFLNQNGNTSAAARALHLSRHSLLYRLRKIEQMTDRSLDSHEDRFLLELSLKLLRFDSGRDRGGG
jgi:PucR family transcriptional regulator, purine catabolism regulatory protein